MSETEDWVPICAWVRALAHHWPSQLDAIFGPAAPELVETLTKRIDDRGRYLKLRRIATENLASINWDPRPPG